MKIINAKTDTFAAALPICGGGDLEQAARLKDLPIWAFHGALDKVVKPERSRDMIQAIRQAGCSSQVVEVLGKAKFLRGPFGLGDKIQNRPSYGQGVPVEKACFLHARQGDDSIAGSFFTMGKATPKEKPVLYWDGDCGFCRQWIERWEEATQGHVEYETLQKAPPEVVAAAGGDPPQQIVLAQPDGTLLTGAHAALAALATSGGAAQFLLAAYHAIPAGRAISEFFYRQVARHRSLGGFLTRLLWGASTHAPAYQISGWLFPRLLGVVFVCAFVSLWVQIDGLAGSHGILPVTAQLDALRGATTAALWFRPSLLWLGASDGALHGWLAVGTVASLLLALGIRPVIAAFVAWLCYLSFVTTVPVFLNFQWDALLLEVGLLAVFCLPWRRGQTLGSSALPRLGRLLIWWLLFRLMFESGVVKLHGFDMAGHNAWLDGTALDFHYFTQPIPAWTSWWAVQLPHWFNRLSLFLVLVIELILPFALLGPRRLRMTAFWGFTALMLLILATGNYGFFNLLTLVLCVTLVDDASWPAPLRRWLVRRKSTLQPAPTPRFQRFVLPVFAALILSATTAQLLLVLHKTPPAWTVKIMSALWPLRSTNSYGLFSVMTTERPEITIETSADGLTWEPLVFRYKMAPGKSALPLFPPHMPRLDWQMWFAALEFRATGRIPDWMSPFLHRVMQQSPSVLALLKPNPALASSPRFLRIRLDLLTFTSWRDPECGNRIWNVHPLPAYTQVFRLPPP